MGLEHRKKRILIFAASYLPFVGGAELAVKEITDRLVDFEFDMITLRFDSKLPEFERVGNINVHRIGMSKKNPSPEDMISYPLKLGKYFFPFSAFRKAGKLNKKNNYDATWSIMANYAGFAAMFFKKFNPRISFLLTLQEGDPLDHYRRRTRAVKPLFEKIFISADRVQAISAFLGDYAKSVGHKKEPVIIPNGVDLGLFTSRYAKEELDDMKRRLNKKEDEIFLATTSRLVEKNGIEDVIKAMTMLPDRVKFIIMGTGPDEMKLKLLAKSKSLEERVTFLGHIPAKNLPKYLKISDIFIRPSLSEGLGNSFLEAMAAGLPVIATPVGGIPDFLADPFKDAYKKPTGFFCRPRDPEDIAEKVRYILDHQEELEEIRKNAFNMVVSKYNWDIVAGKMRAVFGGLADGS